MDWMYLAHLRKNPSKNSICKVIRSEKGGNGKVPGMDHVLRKCHAPLSTKS